ncbi:MAG: AAA family ATPase [FCB group bacterium]|nr:AAA family ATPase [FCB group bacterium]
MSVIDDSEALVSSTTEDRAVIARMWSDLTGVPYTAPAELPTNGTARPVPENGATRHTPTPYVAPHVTEDGPALRAIERSLLSAVLQDAPTGQEVLDELRAIQPDEWTCNLHSQVAGIIVELNFEGIHPGIANVATRVYQRELDLSAADVADITSERPTNDPHGHAQIIRDRFRARDLSLRLKYASELATRIPPAELSGLISSLSDNTDTDTSHDLLPWTNVADWLGAEPKAPEWIFTQRLQRGIVAGLAARGGAGKSWFLLELATSLATGLEIFPGFSPAAPMRVLAVFGEDDEGEVHRRWKRIARVFQLDQDARRTFAENSYLICGWRAPLMQDSECPRPTAAFERLYRTVKSFEPDLIIIDPKSQFFGLSENDNDQTVQWYTNLSRLINVGSSRASVLVCQHVSKGKQEDSDDGAVRGASANRDDVRAFFSMTGVTAQEAAKLGLVNPHHFVKLEQTKASYTDKFPEPMILQRCIDSPDVPEHASKGGVLFAVDGASKAAETAAALLEHTRNALLELLGDNPSGLSVTETTRGKEAKDLRDSIRLQVPGASNRIISAALDDAVLKGLLTLEQVAVRGGLKQVPRKARTDAESL